MVSEINFWGIQVEEPRNKVGFQKIIFLGSFDIKSDKSQLIRIHEVRLNVTQLV